MAMNLSTLVYIIRPDMISNWEDNNPWFKESKVDEALAAKYELVESRTVFKGSTAYREGVTNYQIIRNKETGILYQVEYNHDSWEDEPFNGFDEYTDIDIVEPVEVTKIEYKVVNNVYLVDM